MIEDIEVLGQAGVLQEGQPLWTIMVPTVGWRTRKFVKLMQHILPAAEKDGGIEVVALYNNGEEGVGYVRQKLADDARGAYLSFIDDDDWVADDFIPQVAWALRLEIPPDVVAFTVKIFEGDQPGWTAYHSLRYRPADHGQVLYRDISHVQPMKAELFRLGDFRKGWPEDSSWREKVRPHVRDEVQIDRTLYYYRHDNHDSVQNGIGSMPRIDPPPPRPEVISPAFRWCGE